MFITAVCFIFLINSNMLKIELWAILGFDFFEMSGKDLQKFYMEVLRD